jgi:hypothetical protein
MIRPAMLMFLCGAALALTAVDRAPGQVYPAQFGWQTNLEQAKALARKTGKPLFVVFRCQP